MKVVESRAAFDVLRASLPGRIGLVPTMGALHAGHAELLAVARASADTVIATIFVNPLQFGPAEDLARYPRSLDADLASCEAEGVDVVWTPGVDDVYPHGASRVRFDPGALGAELEGASRPGHFAGMLTVVGKFFNIARPHCAFFGQKDYQQFCLIDQLVSDLDFGVELIAVPTVREPDGLALSSRNRYLSAGDRTRALALSRALFAGRDAAAGGADEVLAAAQRVLHDAGVVADYLELRDRDLRAEPVTGSARLLVAARIGSTRLIDNVEVLL